MTKRTVAALWVALALAGPAAAGTALPRVASISLCADQVVLALADPGQIVSVSHQATDRRLSLMAAAAAAYPTNRGAAEELLAARAEVVVGSAWGHRATARVLERFGVRVLPIGLTDRLDEVARTTVEVAAALGQAARGKALATALRVRAARIAAHRPGRGRLAAYLRPGGGSAARATFVHTLLDLVGLRNLAAEVGQTGWGRLDLEAMVRTPPDVLVISFFDSPHHTIRTRYSRHPVFHTLMARTPVIDVPGNLWVCPGWFMIGAAARMADALDATEPPS